MTAPPVAEVAPAPTVEEMAAEARAFLDAHARPRAARAEDVATGRVGLPVVTGTSGTPEEAEEVAAARAWRRTVFDAGLGWIGGPVELGGRGLGAAHERAYAAAERAYEVPDRSFTRTGTAIIGPALLDHGPDPVRALLPAVHRGDTILCQLFSEPDAGSDLANVATRAERDGDTWRLSGQKVWSSGAHYADVGACLARTSAEGAKHAGLSMFLVDLRAPGVEVRPLRQMTGGAEFDEVFLDGVAVAADALVGAEGEGWPIALQMLMNERAAIGDEMLPDPSLLRRLVDEARAGGALASPVVRQALVDVHVHDRTTRWLADRILGGLADGAVPGPELAMAKLAVTDVARRLSGAAGLVWGGGLVAGNPEAGGFAWSELVLGVPGLSVGGGTDEVLRNGLGERVLGLPREPRPPSDRST